METILMARQQLCVFGVQSIMILRLEKKILWKKVYAAIFCVIRSPETKSRSQVRFTCLVNVTPYRDIWNPFWISGMIFFDIELDALKVIARANKVSINWNIDLFIWSTIRRFKLGICETITWIFVSSLTEASLVWLEDCHLSVNRFC